MKNKEQKEKAASRRQHIYVTLRRYNLHCITDVLQIHKPQSDEMYFSRGGPIFTFNVLISVFNSKCMCQ